MQGFIFLSYLCIGSLFAMTGLRQFFIEPLAGGATNAVWFGLQVLPLLAILPGLMRGTRNAPMYAIIVAMLYFVHGVLVAATDPLRWFGLIEIVFALALTWVSTMLLKRMRQTQGGDQDDGAPGQ
jgi:uncharacterized membrane protein